MHLASRWTGVLVYPYIDQGDWSWLLGCLYLDRKERCKLFLWPKSQNKQHWGWSRECWIDCDMSHWSVINIEGDERYIGTLITGDCCSMYSSLSYNRTLQWRHDASNYTQIDCLLGSLFGLNTKEASTLFALFALWVMRKGFTSPDVSWITTSWLLLQAGFM